MFLRANNPRRPLTAITGGIGTGKSVVSRLLRIMGYRVYDCDERARWVMTHDALLRQQLTALFGPETYLPTAVPTLNKPYLAQQIFSSPDALQQVNACVHPAVARDLLASDVEFFESAILFESHFAQLVPPAEVWTVSAPLELRIARAMARDHASRDQVLERIASQLPQADKECRADHVILNDDRHSIIRQIHNILATSHA